MTIRDFMRSISDPEVTTCSQVLMLLLIVTILSVREIQV